MSEISWNCQGKNLVMENCPKTFKFYDVIIMKSLLLNMKLTVWSLTLTLVQAWYEYQLKWSRVPRIIRELSGNFSVWRVVTLITWTEHVYCTVSCWSNFTHRCFVVDCLCISFTDCAKLKVSRNVLHISDHVSSWWQFCPWHLKHFWLLHLSVLSLFT